MMKDGEIRIGVCGEGDLCEMAAIESDSFPSPWSENLFRCELKNPIARVLVARLETSPDRPLAGYIVYWRVADEMHLHNIAVGKSYRRKRVAFRLLREAILASRSEGALSATLEVRRSNVAARKLYENFGFFLKGVRPGYYSDTGEDALIFWAELDQTLPGGAPSKKPARKE